MLSAGFDDVIVVDFDCPQQTAEWCRKNHPAVKVVKIENEPFFNLSKARNMGAAASSQEWLCFVDADVELAEGFVGWFRKNARKGFFYRLRKIELENSLLGGADGYSGTILCERAAFEAIDGFDEILTDWGMEDRDFYLRLELNDFKPRTLPSALIRGIIQHDDASRTQFYRVKDHAMSHLRNKFYCVAKLKLMNFFKVKNLAIALRAELFAEATKAAQERSLSSNKRVFRYLRKQQHKNIELLEKLKTKVRRLLTDGTDN